jgi:hypothetical protein
VGLRDFEFLVELIKSLFPFVLTHGQQAYLSSNFHLMPPASPAWSIVLVVPYAGHHPDSGIHSDEVMPL